MLGIFNGVYKDNEIMVDVVQIAPSEYDLNENYIWFDVGISVYGNPDITLSAFRFYLVDSNKRILNPDSVFDSFHYVKTENDFGVFVSFDFKPDFFYSTPVFGFYYDTYKRLELIDLAN